MGRVVAHLVSYPPARYIGAELYTHGLLRRLADRGHDVTAHVLLPDAIGEYEDVRVLSDGDLPHEADIFIAHADFAVEARTRKPAGAKVVLIAHNERAEVQDGVRMTAHDLLVATSAATARTLPAAFRPEVYHPPTPPVRRIAGRRVTLINLNEDKGGEILRHLAHRMPDVDFLGVRGGYGTQVGEMPDNVMMVDHVPPHQMDDRVWRFTRLLIMPSGHESWGSTASEAMSRGIPVVSTATPGLVENMGPCGAFVERGDLRMWETAIRHHLGAHWAEASRQVTLHVAKRPDELNLLTTRLEQMMGGTDVATADQLADVPGRPAGHHH